MKLSSSIVVATLLTTVMLFGGQALFGQVTCDRGGNHTIQVSVGSDGNPVLSYRGGSAENVYVCNGDQVQWVLTDSDRGFLVDFFGNAPFAGAASRGSSSGAVSVTIGASAGSYDYNVEFEDGGELDPRIIVEN